MLSDGDFVDRPATRADDWAGIIRGIDARLGAAVDQDSDDVGGGLEQARHPGQEIDRPLLPDTISADPLGLGEDEDDVAADQRAMDQRSEEHTSELQSLMRISYAVFCLKKKTKNNKNKQPNTNIQ